MAQHQHGHLSEKQVNFICKSYDNEVMQKFIKDENGLYFNERLDEEISKRKLYCNSRGVNRHGKTKVVKPKKQKKSYDFHMENENENEIDNKIEIEYPFISENFKTVWNQFLQFRTSIKKPLKPISQQAQLLKLSKYTEQTATEMILQSIANGWQGIFELKTKNTNGKQTSNKFGKSASELLQEVYDRIDAEAAQKHSGLH